MTPFTEDEQWDHDYEIFVLDMHDRIARLNHVGWRLLPPNIAKSKEKSETLDEYFIRLNNNSENYRICPYLDKALDKKMVIDIDLYIKYESKVSLKGIYAYDSYIYDREQRPYFRVTIPLKPLTLSDLPQNIQDILIERRLKSINFLDDYLLSEEIVNTL